MRIYSAFPFSQFNTEYHINHCALNESLFFIYIVLFQRCANRLWFLADVKRRCASQRVEMTHHMTYCASLKGRTINILRFFFFLSFKFFFIFSFRWIGRWRRLLAETSNFWRSSVTVMTFPWKITFLFVVTLYYKFYVYIIYAQR